MSDQAALTPKLDFSPAVIKISNIEDIKNYVHDVVAKYGNVIVTDDTKADATDARKQLKATADELKEVAKKINDKVLENSTPIIAELQKSEKEARNAWRKIQDQIAELDKRNAEAKAKERELKIKEYIVEKNKEYNIDLKRINFGAKWYTTETYKNIFANIDEQFETIKKADHAKEVEKVSIATMARINDLDIDTYVALLDTTDYTEVTALIAKAIENRKQRLEAEKKEQERIIEAEKQKQRDLLKQDDVKPNNVNRVANSDSNVTIETPDSVFVPQVNKSALKEQPEPNKDIRKIKQLILNVNADEYNRVKEFLNKNNIQHKFSEYKG